jgi:hypothetical protein
MDSLTAEAVLVGWKRAGEDDRAEAAAYYARVADARLRPLERVMPAVAEAACHGWLDVRAEVPFLGQELVALGQMIGAWHARYPPLWPVWDQLRKRASALITTYSALIP